MTPEEVKEAVDAFADYLKARAERESLESALLAEHERAEAAYREAKLLFDSMAPAGCEPLPDAAGLITQINNMVAGLNQDAARWRAVRGSTTEVSTVDEAVDRLIAEQEAAP